MGTSLMAPEQNEPSESGQKQAERAIFAAYPAPWVKAGAKGGNVQPSQKNRNKAILAMFFSSPYFLP